MAQIGFNLVLQICQLIKLLVNFILRMFRKEMTIMEGEKNISFVIQQNLMRTPI